MITGSMEVYISELEGLTMIVNQTSDNMKLWGQKYDICYKTNSIWKKLFRGLAKGFLSL